MINLNITNNKKAKPLVYCFVSSYTWYERVSLIIFSKSYNIWIVLNFTQVFFCGWTWAGFSALFQKWYKLITFIIFVLSFEKSTFTFSTYTTFKLKQISRIDNIIIKTEWPKKDATKKVQILIYSRSYS